VESGSHAELVAMNGLYAGLYRANYASFDDVERGDLAPAEVSR
jgi:hypothetical protein